MNTNTNIPTTEETILKNAILFSFQRRAWSNRATVSDRDKAALADALDTKRTNVTVKLIDCPELDAIHTELNALYTWCCARSMQTSMSRGTYFLARSIIPDVKQKVAETKEKIFGPDGLLDSFIAAYPQAKEDAKLPQSPKIKPENDTAKYGLGPLYREGNYPTPEQLRQAFAVEYRLFTISIPENLEAEDRAEETRKLKADYEAAGREIITALREGFAQLVAHAVDRLTVKPGEKPPIFKDSFKENWLEFIETFKAKNFMDDKQLADQVAAAKSIIGQLPADLDNLRKNASVRNFIADKFAGIKKTADEMVTTAPGRLFDLTEE